MASLKLKKSARKKKLSKGLIDPAKASRANQVNVSQKDLDKITTKVLAVEAWEKKKSGLLSGRSQPNKKRQGLQPKRFSEIDEDWG